MRPNTLHRYDSVFPSCCVSVYMFGCFEEVAIVRNVGWRLAPDSEGGLETEAYTYSQGSMRHNTKRYLTGHCCTSQIHKSNSWLFDMAYLSGRIYCSGVVLSTWWRLYCCCNKVKVVHKVYFTLRRLFMIDNGWSSQGLVVVWELQLERRGRPERVSVSWEHRGQNITALCWDTNALKVFIGDMTGKVSSLRAGSSKMGKVVPTKCDALICFGSLHSALFKSSVLVGKVSWQWKAHMYK